MNAKSRAKLAAIPTRRLNLNSQAGLREWRRRMHRKAADWGRAWEHQTERRVGKPRSLRNEIGQRQRWAWVPHTANKENK